MATQTATTVQTAAGMLRTRAVSSAAPAAAPDSSHGTVQDRTPCCYICRKPCVSRAGTIQTREAAHALLCRFTVNGVRVPDGEPYTSVVRGTHYARPTGFDCPLCGASVCCLCLYQCLLEGIKYVANHAITCACKSVSLINEQTVCFLTEEQVSPVPPPHPPPPPPPPPIPSPLRSQMTASL